MTGPAYGKLPLKGARIFINNREIKGEVYIHVKGYALARVTHLDIEASELNEVYKPSGGGFLSIYGIEGGIKIKIREGLYVTILHKLLNRVLAPGEKTRTWVGGKEGGIYIGFRKSEVKKLEEIARDVFGFQI